MEPLVDGARLVSQPGLLEVPGEQDAAGGRADPRADHEARVHLQEHVDVLLLQVRGDPERHRAPADDLPALPVVAEGVAWGEGEGGVNASTGFGAPLGSQPLFPFTLDPHAVLAAGENLAVRRRSCTN